MAQHKHAALIKAWADGAIIQTRINKNDWVATSTPQWLPSNEYRIKPAEKPAEILKCRIFVYRCSGKLRTGAIQYEELHLLHKESFVCWISEWTEIKVTE
jgi:hypothetical protein